MFNLLLDGLDVSLDQFLLGKKFNFRLFLGKSSSLLFSLSGCFGSSKGISLILSKGFCFLFSLLLGIGSGNNGGFGLSILFLFKTGKCFSFFCSLVSFGKSLFFGLFSFLLFGFSFGNGLGFLLSLQLSLLFSFFLCLVFSFGTGKVFGLLLCFRFFKLGYFFTVVGFISIYVGRVKFNEILTPISSVGAVLTILWISGDELLKDSSCLKVDFSRVSRYS